MTWLIATVCLALGVVVGVIFAKRINSGSERVKELEDQVRNLEDRHSRYRESVSEHFGLTAELVQQMTESYREVYQHLATGARELCSADVASKLLPAGNEPGLENGNPGTGSSFNPPKDYVAKHSPGQKGALAEDFGLENPRTGTDEEV
ncbi:MAG: DUF1043 family protein [Pseudohongiellaceae bacterium]